MKRSNPEEHPRSQGFSQSQEKVWEQVCERREVREMEVGGGEGEGCFSLRSKRFRLVSEQRKTEERDSWFWPREKWNARSLTHVPRSLLLNRTETLATQAKGVLKVNGQGIFACWLLRLVSIFF